MADIDQDSYLLIHHNESSTSFWGFTPSDSQDSMKCKVLWQEYSLTSSGNDQKSSPDNFCPVGTSSPITSDPESKNKSQHKHSHYSSRGLTSLDSISHLSGVAECTCEKCFNRLLTEKADLQMEVITYREKYQQLRAEIEEQKAGLNADKVSNGSQRHLDCSTQTSAELQGSLHVDHAIQTIEAHTKATQTTLSYNQPMDKQNSEMDRTMHSSKQMELINTTDTQAIVKSPQPQEKQENTAKSCQPTEVFDKPQNEEQKSTNMKAGQPIPTVKLSKRQTATTRDHQPTVYLEEASPSTILIGSSILQGIRTKGLQHGVRVMTLHGAKINDVKNQLSKMDLTSTETVVLQVGTND